MSPPPADPDPLPGRIEAPGPDAPSLAVRASASAHRLVLPALVALLALLGVLYFPATRNLFMNDDFMNLSYISKPGLDPGYIFAEKTGVFLPLSRLYLELLFPIFGLSPGGYYAANIALHLANTVLAYLIGAAMFGSRGRGLLTAALFGMIPAYSEAVLHISARGFLLAGFWFFLSTWLFVLCLRRLESAAPRALPLLALSCVAYFLMQACYGYGPEVPFLFFALYFAIRPAQFRRAGVLRACLTCLPFLLTLVAYQALAHFLRRPDLSTQFYRPENLPLAEKIRLAALCYPGGIQENFLRFLFSLPIAEWIHDRWLLVLTFSAPQKAVYTFAVLAVGTLFLKFDRNRLLTVLPLSACLLFWFMAQFGLAILSRINYGYEVILLSERYFYLPALSFALLCASLTRLARPLRAWADPKLPLVLLGLGALGAVVSSFMDVSGEVARARADGEAFRKIYMTLIGHVHQVLTHEQETIILPNNSFMTPGADFITTNPEHIIRTFMPDYVDRITFVRGQQFMRVWLRREPNAYRIMEDGHLRNVRLDTVPAPLLRAQEQDDGSPSD